MMLLSRCQGLWKKRWSQLTTVLGGMPWSRDLVALISKTWSNTQEWLAMRRRRRGIGFPETSIASFTRPCRKSAIWLKKGPFVCVTDPSGDSPGSLRFRWNITSSEIPASLDARLLASYVISRKSWLRWSLVPGARCKCEFTCIVNSKGAKCKVQNWTKSLLDIFVLDEKY